MMVISNPQPMWPGHFINHLNKMQNRASKSNGQYKKHGGPCMFPRGTGCPAKGSGGFGRDMKREGCKVLPPPFCWMTNQQYCNNLESSTGENSGKNSQQSKAKRCKTDESCRTQSPMNDLFNIGEIMRATEESIRNALESANLNSQDSKEFKDSKDCKNSKDSKDSKDSMDSEHRETSKDQNNSDSDNTNNDLNNLGEVIKALLGSFGVNADISTKTDSNEKGQKSNEKSQNTSEEENMDSENSDSRSSVNKENSVEADQNESQNQTKSDEKCHNSNKPEEMESQNKKNSTEESKQNENQNDSSKQNSEAGAKPKTRSIPILTENHNGNKENSNIEKDVQEAMEETQMPISPKIKVALQAMENMGFNNNDGWLSDLLMKYDGDIGKVLDLINKRN